MWILPHWSVSDSVLIRAMLQFSGKTCVWSYFLWELSNIIPTLTASLISEAFFVSSGLVFSSALHATYWILFSSPWVQWSPDHLYSDALMKLMCWFYVFNLPWSPQSPLFPPFPLSHSSEDPLPLWSQSPVKGLKRLNSWRLLGPLWFILSISLCPLSKFTIAKWGTLSPKLPIPALLSSSPDWVPQL